MRVCRATRGGQSQSSRTSDARVGCERAQFLVPFFVWLAVSPPRTRSSGGLPPAATLALQLEMFPAHTPGSARAAGLGVKPDSLVSCSSVHHQARYLSGDVRSGQENVNGAPDPLKILPLLARR